MGRDFFRVFCSYFVLKLAGCLRKRLIPLSLAVFNCFLQTSRSAVLTPITKQKPAWRAEPEDSTPIKLTHLREDWPAGQGWMRGRFKGGQLDADEASCFGVPTLEPRIWRRPSEP